MGWSSFFADIFNMKYKVVSDTNGIEARDLLMIDVQKFMDTTGDVIRPDPIPKKIIQTAFSMSRNKYLKQLVLDIFNIVIKPRTDIEFIRSFRSINEYKTACLSKYASIVSIMLDSLQDGEEKKRLFIVKQYGKTMPSYKMYDTGHAFFYKNVAFNLALYEKVNRRYLQAYTDGVIEYFVNADNWDKEHLTKFIRFSYHTCTPYKDINYAYKAYNNSFAKYGVNATLIDCKIYWQED